MYFLFSCLRVKLREEVTKLKFEAKTFHIYANQKEVCVCIIKMLLFLDADAQEVKWVWPCVMCRHNVVFVTLFRSKGETVGEKCVLAMGFRQQMKLFYRTRGTYLEGLFWFITQNVLILSWNGENIFKKLYNYLLCWTCYRIGRSYWHILHLHLRPVSICGSVAWRIRPSTSESKSEPQNCEERTSLHLCQ